MDFSLLAASFFAPHLFCGSLRAGLGCGASALALITGVAPEVISSQNNGAHYSDRFMTRFLRARNFVTLRLTPAMVARARSPLGSDHVLLISQLFRATEGTRGAVFSDFYYHNFNVYELSSLSFLNKPILSAYVVFHRSWRVRYVKKKPSPKVPAKRRRLTLPSLSYNLAWSPTGEWIAFTSEHQAAVHLSQQPVGPNCC